MGSVNRFIEPVLINVIQTRQYRLALRA